MIWAYQQRLDPFLDTIRWSDIWSTILAALPVVTLFWLLVMRRWLAPKAAAGGAIVAFLIAVIVYQMPPVMTGMAFVSGAAFGLLPVGFTIFNTMLLYNITVETGHFAIVRRSVAELSADARIQAILIGFAFGAFLEGAAGGGTPVAICGAILVGLGFNPFLAAVLCLIANTSPVAYGGLGTPLIVLFGVTDLPTETLSVMAGHQLPILSFLIPLYMVKCMCTWKQTWEVMPALLVSGGSFALFQYSFATMHQHVPGLVLYPMTDIGGGIFSLVVTAIFLKLWKPKKEWHFDKTDVAADLKSAGNQPAPKSADFISAATKDNPEAPLTTASVSLAWAPYAIMSGLLLLTGIVRQEETPKEGVKEGPGPVQISGSLYTNYQIPIPTLHRESF